MVAASLSLLLMAVIWGAMRLLGSSGSSIRASQEPRKQLRAALVNLQNDLRRAAYLFPDGTYTVLGDTITVAPPGTPGSALAFAIPENSVPPLLYTVVVVYSKPRPQPDSNTPDARSLVYYKVKGIDPPVSDLPGEIDLDLLPANGSLKTFDTYLRDPDGFQAEITSNQHAVRLSFHIRRQEARGELQQSSYETTLALRNIL